MGVGDIVDSLQLTYVSVRITDDFNHYIPFRISPTFYSSNLAQIDSTNEKLKIMELNRSWESRVKTVHIYRNIYFYSRISLDSPRN
jgi:hypothetical protein